MRPARTFERSLARTRYRILSYDEDVQLRMLDDSVAYVALNSFGSGAVVAAFDSLFGKIGDARGLILDLRQNTGGNSQVGWDILAYLADKPFETGVWQTRIYEPTVRAWGMATRWHTTVGPTCEPLGTKHYGGPVVVLCGALTGSAAEDFLMAFDAMGRGSSSASPRPGRVASPSGSRSPAVGPAACARPERPTPTVRSTWGRGSAPDVVVHPTPADVRQGRDPVLEAAVEALGRSASTF